MDNLRDSSSESKTPTSVIQKAAEPLKISVSEAWDMVQRGENPCFLDTRNLKHYRKSDVKIPGSLRIWREDLAERIGEVPRDRTIIAYCSCHRENSSGKAVLILNANGIEDAYALVGGTDAWRDSGLPLDPKEEWETD